MIDAIVTGDCLDTLPAIEAGSVDLVMTSPPYPGQKGDRRGVDEWLAWFTAVAAAMSRVLKPTGVLVLNCAFKRRSDGFFDGRLYTRLPLILEATGFHWVDLYPFIKANPAPNGRNGAAVYCDSPGWEPIFVFTLADSVQDYTFNPVRRSYRPKSLAKNGAVYSTRGDNIQPHPSGARQPNVVIVSTSGSSRTAVPRARGQSYPTEIPERFILQYTNPGDLVLDPFAGVGTTCRVAQTLGRHYIGIELQPDEADAAREWLARPYQAQFSAVANH